MEKYIIDERTGLKYELVGDYYFIAGDDEPEEQRHIGIWGQRHGHYLRQTKKAIYTGLLISGELPDYLADIDEQAEEMFSQLVKQMAEREGVTERLKAQDQMTWVRHMNNIQDRVREIVNHELIYA
ncbi:MAG: TnpV protein [Lachnospiraceae bacterium]|nr:TnpV protein [Lachnospiraceae bacterium]